MQNVLVRPQATVLKPLGSLNAANVTKFQYQLNEAVLSDQNGALLIDLGQVEFIDSAGLMVLVSAQSMAQRLNKRLSICSISYPVRMIFELTQLDRVFEIFEGHAAFHAAIA
ncbi:STAS domain-containing protein [Kovacikia minuta CCNUW1]|uniref:STAS domain-containing protein n=1 Tax=Kovacikia minuta TaxID=2931930 RepID=UPI001CD0379E|nr:STAS domain-containing protein [Kovacikia minuta]UBF26295.1 STAS domain-containing protein [Kovacikia minuta CCNUW1]